jgi:transcriptional regulator with XRE-family HTH domain
MNIGSYLKQLRIEKGYTLNDAAEKVSMSASFISQLENMKLSPSLESLEKLVSLYAINLSDFFKQIEQKKYIIVRKNDEKKMFLSDGAITLTPLASKLQNNSLETITIRFHNKAQIETAVLPKEINGERVIYILKGKIFICINNEEPVELQEGDSINYKSYIPCRIFTEEELEPELLISGVPPLLV